MLQVSCVCWCMLVSCEIMSIVDVPTSFFEVNA
jgi:hypothetical protein